VLQLINNGLAIHIKTLNEGNKTIGEENKNMSGDDVYGT